MKHYPKGSMCRSCKHAHRRCDHLDFSAMPVIEHNSTVYCEPVNIVRCQEFERVEEVQK